jgi:hypothetical protein
MKSRMIGRDFHHARTLKRAVDPREYPVILCIGAQDTAQMRFAERNGVIEAVPATREAALQGSVFTFDSTGFRSYIYIIPRQSPHQEGRGSPETTMGGIAVTSVYRRNPCTQFRNCETLST